MLQFTQRNSLSGIGLASLFILLGAFAFEYIWLILPCDLCLKQRYAYYAAILLAGGVYFLNNPRFFKITLKLLAVIFLLNMWLGIYHAGAEWAYWPGPASCSGSGNATLSVQDLMKNIPQTRIISCTKAAWRLFGLSLAGYNVLLSAGLALFAFLGAMRRN